MSVSTVQDGASPLLAASQEGHTDVVDILIKAGADIHQAITEVCISWVGHDAVLHNHHVHF